MYKQSVEIINYNIESKQWFIVWTYTWFLNNSFNKYQTLFWHEISIALYKVRFFTFCQKSCISNIRHTCHIDNDSWNKHGKNIAYNCSNVTNLTLCIKLECSFVIVVQLRIRLHCLIIKNKESFFGNKGRFAL